MFEPFIWCFHAVSYVLINVGVILSFLYDCVYVYIVWFEYIFIIGLFYWDVFYCAWQGPMEEQSCTDFFLPCINIFEKKYVLKIADRIAMIKPSSRWPFHYTDVTIDVVAHQMTDTSTVCSTIRSGAHRHWLCEGNPPVTHGFPSQWRQ